MKKIFYVSRTENTQTGQAGEATLIRASDPVKLQIVDDLTVSSPITDQLYATVETAPAIAVVSDTVQSGDYNPVSSDAVLQAIKDWNELDDEWVRVSATTAVAEHDGFVVAYPNNNSYVNITNPTTGVTKSFNNGGQTTALPVKKGETVTATDPWSSVLDFRYYSNRG